MIGVCMKKSAFIYSISIMFKSAPWFCVCHILNAIIMSTKVYASAYINKQLLNTLINQIQIANKNINKIIGIFILLFMVELAYTISSGIIGYFISRTSMTYHDKMNILFLNKLASLDISIYDSPNTRDYITQSQKDMESIRAVYINFISLITAIISTIVSLSIIVKLDYILCAIIFISMLPSFFFKKKIQKDRYEKEKKLNLTGRKISYFSGLFKGRTVAQEMRLFDFSGKIIYSLKKLYAIRNIENLKLERKSLAIELFSTIVTGILNIIYNIYIVFVIILRNLTVGDFSYYSSISSNFKKNIETIFNTASSYLINAEKVKNFRGFMEKKSEIIDLGHRIPDTANYIIEFSNVSFTYPNSSVKVIDNLSFSIKNGEKVALAGLNGAGKSTIVKLLLRLYDPSDGHILLNGIDIKNYSLKEYRKMFSTVFQECVNYSMSIKENICISNYKKAENEFLINKALYFSGLSRVIDSIDTQIGKDFDSDGIILSKGQAQCLCMARSIYREAPILVFDEPTASLDAESEQRLFDNIFSNMEQNKSIIVISHRLSNLKNVDKIIFLKNGKCIEHGSHETLCQLNKEYFKLYQTQARRYL